MNSEFKRKSQTIASNIQKISQNVSSMQRLLLSSTDDSEMTNQINSIIHYTGQLAKDTKEDLKALIVSNDVGGLGINKEEKMFKEKLTSDFSAILNQFQQAQRTATNREKEKVKSLTAPKSDYYNSGVEQDLLPGPNAYHTQQGPGAGGSYQQQQSTMSAVNLQELRERENSIRQLESDILDVNQIFKELATMVHEQGDTIDSIEANIESTSFSVHQGVEEIGRAAKYQTSARRKKIYLFGILAVVLITIILIIVYAN